MINAFYKKYQKHFDVSENNFAHFVMWSCGGICIGFVIGLVGIAFHLALEWATEFRTAHPMLLWLLPFGGLAIVLAYRLLVRDVIFCSYLGRRTRSPPKGAN